MVAALLTAAQSLLSSRLCRSLFVKRVIDEKQKLLQFVQIQSGSASPSDVCFPYEILSPGFLPLGLTGLLHKSLCRSPSLFLLNFPLLYSDESRFHYLPRRLRPPRCFPQHTEELLHKSPVYRANRLQCQERHRRRKMEQTGHLCLLLSRSSCVFVASSEEPEKNRADEFPC